MSRQQRAAETAASTATRIWRQANCSWPHIKKEWHPLFFSEPPIAGRRFVEKRIVFGRREIEFAEIMIAACSKSTVVGSANSS